MYFLPPQAYSCSLPTGFLVASYSEKETSAQLSQATKSHSLDDLQRAFAVKAETP
jgi:hypothetical protein